MRAAATEIPLTGSTIESGACGAAEALSWLVVDAGQTGGLAAKDAGAVGVRSVSGDTGRARGAAAAGKASCTTGDTSGLGKIEPARASSALGDIVGVAA